MQPIHIEVRNLFLEIIEQFIATECCQDSSLPQPNIKSSEVFTLECPRQQEFGHFASPFCFVLSKKMKKAPKDIATSFIEFALQNKRVSERFSKIEQVNGYINVTLNVQYLDTLCTNVKHYFKPFSKQGQRILLEFVSANPTGPLHIGHARGAIYGDSLKRIGEFLGFEIVSEYYINDAGAQIFTLGLSVFLAGRATLGLSVIYPKSYYRGEYIDEIAKNVLEKFDREIFEDRDGLLDSILIESRGEYIDEISNPKANIFKQEGRVVENIKTLARYAKSLMLDEIKDNLASLNIVFDNFVSEESLFSHWGETLEKLQRQNGVRSEDGKLWLESSRFGDEKDRVIVRENGEPTYLAGDIIYHSNKFERKFDHYINIWGADHHGYVGRVRAAIEFLGYDSGALEVLLSQMVALKKDGQNYKMSKRAGNFILLKDVLEDIGADALRFIFLTKRIDTHLEFDVSSLSKQDANNPIFYINYANARIHTLLEKSGLDEEVLINTCVPSMQDEHLARDLHFLTFQALNIFQVLQTSFKEREVQKVCDYLKNVASDFHSFYNTYRILDSKNTAYILKHLLVVSKALSLGLKLIGIDAKTKM